MGKSYDHRTCIYDAAESDTRELSEAPDHIDYINEQVLEVDHMQSPFDPDRYRTRFLLGLGGPTVEVVVDSRDGVTYCHSHGKASRHGRARDLREIDLRGSERQTWEALADTYRECLS